jgi:hypothetical protein
LDPDVTPTSLLLTLKSAFCASKSIMQSWWKMAADTLHALLLVAIQDDQFETIHDNIVYKPMLSIDEILKDTCECDTSMQMKDDAHNITGDGTSLSGWHAAT